MVQLVAPSQTLSEMLDGHRDVEGFDSQGQFVFFKEEATEKA